MPTKQVMKERDRTIRKAELADAHCHLDLFGDLAPVRESISNGVLTIITDGVDTKSNMKALQICDNVNIFAALGIDPEHVLKLQSNELEFNTGLIRQNAARIVAVGEIGLDYLLAKTDRERELQMKVFGSLLALAKELDLPVSVHAREALGDVLSMIKESGVTKVHLHFFSGTEKQAEEAAKLGYMISIPPLSSATRRKAIKKVPLQQLMAETDCPIVGKTPNDAEKSVHIIAETKGIAYEDACRQIAENTKRFFNTHGKVNKSRSPLIRY